jgi:hypothetical protein
MTKEIVLIRCLFPWNILISGPAGRCTSSRPHAQLPPDTVKVASGC